MDRYGQLETNRSEVHRGDGGDPSEQGGRFQGLGSGPAGKLKVQIWPMRVTGKRRVDQLREVNLFVW
jgi:hypothetical protein